MKNIHTVGVKAQLHSFLVSLLDGVECQIHVLATLSPGGKGNLWQEGGLYSLSRQLLENILLLPEIESWNIDSLAHSLITIENELSCLRNKQITFKLII